MEVNIKGTAKEIADIVFQLQSQQKDEPTQGGCSSSMTREQWEKIRKCELDAAHAQWEKSKQCELDAKHALISRTGGI